MVVVGGFSGDWMVHVRGGGGGGVRGGGGGKDKKG